MKRVILNVLIIAITGILFNACEKDPIEEPVACFYTESTTIKKNEYVRFYICGDAMHNTVFSGDFLSVFNGIDSINGRGYYAPGDSIDIKYIKTGEYQPWLLSTNANYNGILKAAVKLDHTIIVVDE